MDDPVVAADGHTYNRTDIENWFKQHNTSPLTNEPLDHQLLLPNIAIRKAIIAWREEHGLPPLVFGPSAKPQPPVAVVNPAPDIHKPAAVCSFSKKALQAYCTTCRKSICISCLTDPARCKSHIARVLDDIVTGVRETHAAWVQVLQGQPQQLQAECDRVTAAADAAVQAIREEEAELKLQLRRVCVGDLEGVVREQAAFLADVELAASSPQSADAGSEESRCLLTAATRAPRPPPPGAGGGRFEPAAAEAVRGRRLGRVVEGVAVAVGGGWVRGAAGPGGVAVAGAGFRRVLGSRGSGNGQFQSPRQCALDHEGNLVVSDYGNHRIQVLRYSDGTHLRTIGSQGSGNGQFSAPFGFAFDGAGHILVADYNNHRVQMLRYSDGAHVRTIGSQGSGNGQLSGPNGVFVDGDGGVVVCDQSNHRVQVFE